MAELKLGNVTFKVDEYPEELPFGGEQALAIRKFAGGGIDIQTLGGFDNPIDWQGTFRYKDAKSRVTALEAMRISGKPVVLSVSWLKRTVVIQNFIYRYVNDFYVPYQLNLIPIPSGTVNGIASTPSSSKTSSSKISSTTKAKEEVRIVKSGDSLWEFAVDKYKDGSKWTIIAKANNIKDSKSLKVGMKIKLPNI